MKPFLSLVAHDLYKKSSGDLSHTVIVFPSKRASLFFNQFLIAETDGKPLFAPTYMTLGELFGSLTDLRSEDHIRLVCLLHKHYIQYTRRQDEEIDRFYNWGELLLSDFDDIDKNLVNPDLLFRNLKNYKELSSPNDYLTDEQRKVIEKFFGGFNADGDNSTIRKNFLHVWEAMSPIYQAFRKGLETEGRGYEGQRFRHAVEHFDADRLTADHYVFVGFNVLSVVERRLFDLVKECGKAMFYWDYDNYYLKNKAAEAGTFLRLDIKQYGNELDEESVSEESPYNNLCHLPRIDIVSAPTDSAQASYAHDWLCENLTDNEQETAVVLADEKLIMPVLHALPMENIRDINVTMGMPMTETTVWQFLQGIIDNEQETLDDRQLEWLRGISTAIDSKGLEMKRLEHRLQEEEEALYRAHLAVNSLIRLVEEGTLKASCKLISRLLTTILKGTTIPFHGEPARGLQVMGVLETRNLDFRHLLLLSTNEGMLPKQPSEVSFIPFSLRKAFGLTTIERQTAVYAYYFYRLIQRAERVTLVYNNGTDGMTKKEPSRFITQLEVEFKGEIRHYALQSENRASIVEPISVEQTAETKRKLVERFTSKPLSPTAINDYFICRLKFYLKYIEGLKYDEEDTEEVTNAQFGTLFHRSAELAYKKLTEADSTVKKSNLLDLAGTKSAIQGLVSQAFKDEYWKTNVDEDIHYTGIHHINFKAICIYLKQLLSIDAQYAPFSYLGSEQPIDGELEVMTEQGPVPVKLGGTIDRMDEKGGMVRIIDYKTGGKDDDKKITKVEDLFNPDVKSRKKYVFQAFYYAWLLCQKESKPISPGLFFVRSSSNTAYDPAILLNKEPVTNFQSQVFKEFDEGMRALLDEMFNSDAPYTQAEKEDSCKYCDFCAICGRKPPEW